MRNPSPTELVEDFDYLRDQGYPDAEFGRIEQTPVHSELLGTAGASLAATEAETSAK